MKILFEGSLGGTLGPCGQIFSGIEGFRLLNFTLHSWELGQIKGGALLTHRGHFCHLSVAHGPFT